MTKPELETAIYNGVPLRECFATTSGQECEIFKAGHFEPTDQILYIPDLYLNEIAAYFDYYHPMEAPNVIEDVLGHTYTGNDFVELCDGDIQKAERLFHYCDWQNPSSALPEIEDDEDTDEHYVAVRTVDGRYLTTDGEVAVFKSEDQARQYIQHLKENHVRVTGLAFRYSIGTCKKCGSPLFPSDLPEYESQCFSCDEDFYIFEQKTEGW